MPYPMLPDPVNEPEMRSRSNIHVERIPWNKRAEFARDLLSNRGLEIRSRGNSVVRWTSAEMEDGTGRIWISCYFDQVLFVSAVGPIAESIQKRGSQFEASRGAALPNLSSAGDEQVVGINWLGFLHD